MLIITDAFLLCQGDVRPTVIYHLRNVIIAIQIIFNPEEVILRMIPHNIFNKITFLNLKKTF